MNRSEDRATSIDLVLLTAPGCHLCTHGQDVLDAVSRTVDVTVREVDLLSDEGRDLAAGARLPFPPGLFVGQQLIAHGRLSARHLLAQLERWRDEPARDDAAGT
jgi:hypothetical protein